MLNSAQFHSQLLSKALLLGICFYSFNAILETPVQAGELQEHTQQGKIDNKIYQTQGRFLQGGNQGNINNMVAQVSRDESCRDPQNLTPEQRQRCRPPSPTFFEQERKLEFEGFGPTFLQNSLNGVSDPLGGTGSTSSQLGTPFGGTTSEFIPTLGIQRIDGEIDAGGGFTGGESVGSE
ncbi:MAG: hypothetical protein F6K16_06545 [Symploca sp. SIO2B6]|nr:hypothetical protein [Symploca sp. SIO2B6]